MSAINVYIMFPIVELRCGIRRLGDYQSVKKDGRPGNSNQACFSLLFVNKAIKAEASHILYCKKLFVINIHIAYTNSDPIIGSERDNLFKREKKRSNTNNFTIDKGGLIALDCFRQIANIEINLIYPTRPITDNAKTSRPIIVRKILYILGGDGKIETDGPPSKEETLKSLTTLVKLGKNCGMEDNHFCKEN